MCFSYSPTHFEFFLKKKHQICKCSVTNGRDTLANCSTALKQVCEINFGRFSKAAKGQNCPFFHKCRISKALPKFSQKLRTANYPT